MKLEAAAKSGKDVGEAADEASEELKQHADDLMDDCKNIEKQHEEISKKGKGGTYQGKGAKYALDPGDKPSDVKKSLDQAIKWLAPDAICKRWERCAKNA
jgi:hypothetical protein